MSEAYPPPQQPYSTPAAGPTGASQGSTRWALGLSIAAITLALLALLFVAVVTFSGFFAYGGFDTYDEAGYESPPTDGTAADLEPMREGDCFVTAVDKPETIEKVDCTDRHDGQIYLITDIDRSGDVDYPGDGRMYDQADQRCYDRWDEQFGSSYDFYYDEPSVSYALFAPTETSWAEGDRTVACAYYSEGLGSLEGLIGGTSEE